MSGQRDMLGGDDGATQLPMFADEETGPSAPSSIQLARMIVSNPASHRPSHVRRAQAFVLAHELENRQ